MQVLLRIPLAALSVYVIPDRWQALRDPDRRARAAIEYQVSRSRGFYVYERRAPRTIDALWHQIVSAIRFGDRLRLGVADADFANMMPLLGLAAWHQKHSDEQENMRRTPVIAN